jgi:hypothetical protein
VCAAQATAWCCPRRIYTSSPVAQALFDQGLLLTYNFNRPEVCAGADWSAGGGEGGGGEMVLFDEGIVSGDGFMACNVTQRELLVLDASPVTVPACHCITA